MKKFITLYEVGPRDGLQNEKKTIPTAVKIDFINALSYSGLSKIEATSFVSPQWVPQLADNAKVMANIQRNPKVHYVVLVPNLEGFKQAIASRPDEIAVFTAASEAFSQKNTNCSIDESIKRIQQIVKANTTKIPMRAYISCVLGCPYEKKVDTDVVLRLAEQLVQLGAYQISLGDTIGIGTPDKAEKLIERVSQQIGVDKVAVHFHDTHHHALDNIKVSLSLGVTTIDSAVSGLGGCPYAPGATGNVSTQAVVNLLTTLGYSTRVNLNQLDRANRLIQAYL